LENFLVGDTIEDIKLIDFGLACKMAINDAEKEFSYVGTPTYMAPEVLSK